jgi:F-type H+-transporting ATPase subunit epsilon
MSLQLTIMTPEGKAFDQPVDLFIVPGTWGTFGVMPRHAPMIASIAAGILTLEVAGRRSLVVVGEGVLEVRPDGAAMLVQLAVPARSAAEAEGKLLDLKNPARHSPHLSAGEGEQGSQAGSGR